MLPRPYLPSQMESFSNTQVALETLPKVDNLVFQPLEWRYRKVLVIIRVFTLLVVGVLIGLLFVGHSIEPLPEQARLGLFYVVPVLYLLYILWSYVSITKRYAHMGYALREQDILYRSGWLWKQMTTVPFNRVQHVSIDQGPVERRYNVSKLKVFTAGGGASDLVIPGLDPTTANDLKEFIVKKTLASDEQE